MKQTHKTYSLTTKLCLQFLLVPLFLVLVTLKSNAQTYSFEFKNTPFKTVIAEITSKTNYQFVFDASYLQQAKPVTITVNSASINQILDAVFQNQTFSYTLSENTIVIVPKKASTKESFTAKGLVIDENKQPIPGVVVKNKSSNNFVLTDANGNFSINLSENPSVLVFSYLGYATEERSVAKNPAYVSLQMQVNAEELSAVVVNGYQTISRERSTAAATILTEKKLNENINVDLLSAIEGRVAGLVYNKNPNGLGADQPELRGRGTYSIEQGNTNPLIVVDGLPTELTLDQINPYDVESVTVLKDGAAASIYGARSANGVIVVTTKKAQGATKISVNSDFFINTKPDLDLLGLASTAQVIDYETRLYNQERSRFATTEAMFQSYGTVANGSIRYYSPLYQLYRDRDAGLFSQAAVDQTLSNWAKNDYMQEYRDQVWQNEFRQRYNISLSTGNTKSNTFVSFNYDKGKERVIGNNNENYNLYFKNSFKPKKWLDITVGLNGQYQLADDTDGSYNNIFLQNRYERIIGENGNREQADYVNFGDSFAGATPINGAVARILNATPAFKSTRFNVLDALDEGVTNSKRIGLRAFTNLQFNITKAISYSTQFQYELNETRRETYLDVNSYKVRSAANALTNFASNTYTYGLPVGGRFEQLNRASNAYTFRNQLNLDKSFDEGTHAIYAIAGFEMRQTFTPRSVQDIRYGYDPVTLSSIIINENELSITGLPSYIYGGRKTLSVAPRTQEESKNRYVSFYTNAGYTFKNKYNLTGSFRIDQTNLYGVEFNDRSRPLWSVGLGWNASNEDFLSNISWLEMLKVRGSYGINGRTDRSTSRYATFRLRNDQLFPSLQFLDLTNLANPMLRWEKTATTNLGVDFALFKNRLFGNIDLYNRYSSDLIVSTELDPTVGTTSIILNNGALRNKGIEITLGGEWLRTKDWKLSSTLVYAYNKNTIEDVNKAIPTPFSYIQSPNSNFFENDAFSSLYGFRYGGIVNGYPYVLDENGNPSIQFDANGQPIAGTIKSINDNKALVNLGTLIPKFNGSFSQRVAYKQFELGMLFIYSGGNKLRKNPVPDNINSIRAANIAVSDGTTPRLPADYPITTHIFSNINTINSQFRAADINVFSADYIKLRNISLSYSLPKTMVTKVGLASARLTGQVNNLWYASAAGDDIDPETYSLNSGSYSIPLPKSFLIGVNVTF
ncbi:SusC/RagA family TonB-linked outer membrane protein [Pedobacter puniceum]|uniref:SusC/RagA family TonB-linked outer membrane protein n=1 Tax=Pedobacter puniceum TaxID=2666136 RepID=A0A7K0FQ47_9SPHI|nr:SusC/RagA family TonB-linked outer membrane protein [Pedobacter puniceum]MRX48089.1 SusC/RagA family TonB-linked outer membrane protein [Pedobacter puniceum]